ncbi:MAG: damage-inducible protein DinB, partial [Thermoanaerobaculia bacterium]
GMEMSEDMMAKMREQEKNVTVKADVIANLKKSIGYGKGAIGDFPVAQLGDEVEFFGMKMSKGDVLLVLLSHSHEHLGQLIAYGRSNGVVPPWSQPKPEEGH